MRGPNGLLVLATLFLFFLPSVSAQEIQVTQLPTLGGAFSIANDINSVGQVTGTSKLEDGTQHAFMWPDENGQMVDIGSFGIGICGRSRGLKINDAGQVIGRSLAFAEGGSGCDELAFIWSPGSRLQSLGVLHPCKVDTTPVDLNNLGEVVGSAHVLNSSGVCEPASFFWPDESGRMLHIAPPEGTQFAVKAINNLGEVIGNLLSPPSPPRAALWTIDGGIVELGSLDPACERSLAYDINDNGQVAGASSVSDPDGRCFEHAVMWNPSEIGASYQIVDLHSVGVSSQGQSINNAGEVSGVYLSSLYEESRPAVWSEGQMTDLGTLDESSYGAFTVMNDVGQVVGTYVLPEALTLAFSWSVERSLEELLDVSGNRYLGGWAYALNSAGQAVGNSTGGAVVWTIPLPPSTPEEQIDQIGDTVNELLEGGTLNEGEAQSLDSKLEAAKVKLSDGQTTSGCNILQAFINQISAKIRASKLSEAEGQALIDAASSVSSCT